MVAKYEKLYASKYVSKDYDKRVQEVVSLMRARYGIAPRKKKADAPRLMGDLGPGDPGRRSAFALRAPASQAMENSSDEGGSGN